MVGARGRPSWRYDATAWFPETYGPCDDEEGVDAGSGRICSRTCISEGDAGERSDGERPEPASPSEGP